MNPDPNVRHRLKRAKARKINLKQSNRWLKPTAMKEPAAMKKSQHQ
jgi:hypothetical protein